MTLVENHYLGYQKKLTVISCAINWSKNCQTEVECSKYLPAMSFAVDFIYCTINQS